VRIKALAQGYARAWATILDANITTLLAMVLLFLFGAGAIRGFAVTMSLGILISMFTAVVLMRMMMEALVRRRKPAAGIAPLIGGVPRPGRFSFMRRGRLALAGRRRCRWGGGALVWPGPNLGIDFTGGVQMVLRSDAPVPLAELRAAIAGRAGRCQPAGLRRPERGADPRAGRGRAGHGERGGRRRRAGRAGRGLRPDRPRRPDDQRRVGTTGLIALSLAVLAMLVYIWVRFEWHFAAGPSRCWRSTSPRPSASSR
jgi:SecD/SecF fusion protein